MNTYSILIISSRPPSHFAGLGKDMVDALTKYGHSVDYLTRYESSKEKVIGLSPEPHKSILRSVFHKIKANAVLGGLIDRMFKKLIKRINNDQTYIRNNGITLVSPDENRPVYSNEVILSKINKKYDFVMVHVWQDMITSISLKAIYEKTKAPILICACDMQPFTGGCFYFRDCNNYTKQCGSCPAFGGDNPNDNTHTNYLVKKEVYSSIPCLFVGNPYQVGFAKKSGMFAEDQLACLYSPLNEDEFIQQDMMKARNHFKIPQNKEFIIFSRFAGLHHKAKGYDYLLESINILADSLSVEQKNKVLLLFAGIQDSEYEKQFKIEVKNVGMLSRNDLIKAYNASSVFVSSSIDEAGPSMLLQSMMCGTPVVAYEVGYAMDLTENGITGYRAKLKNVNDFAYGLRQIFDLSKSEYEKMRNTCRQKCLEKVSFKAFTESIIDLYKKVSEN